MPLTFAEAVQAGSLPADEALALFDGLAPVPLAEMVGTWRGAEFPTGHPMDGLLAASGWYGKRIVDAETVHPLLFYTGDRSRAFAVDPGKVPVGLLRLEHLPLPRTHNLHRLLLAARPALQTHAPKARLRMTEYRGQTSATMIYDDHPIHDAFRRVDDQTVLGAMDMRGMARPYFFVLRRDADFAID
ncbi:MAG: DUF4334 domain-containing protein [Candidatus Sericytochromatia bacterium]